MVQSNSYNRLFSGNFGGMEKIKVNSTLLWKPDIVLHNSVTGNFKTTEQGHHYKITIYENGTVEWQPAALYQTSCGIDTKVTILQDPSE